MEYQQIINLLDNTTNQPNKFRTKSWVERKDYVRGTYSIKLKTSALRSSLCCYSDAYCLHNWNKHYWNRSCKRHWCGNANE